MTCSANLLENFALDSMLSEGCTCNMKGPWVRWLWAQERWLGRGNLKAHPITISPETVSRKAEHFSWGPLPSAFCLGAPFQWSFFFFFFFFSLTFYFWDPWDFKIMFSMFSTFRHFRQCSIYKRINIGINGIKYCSELDTHIYDELDFNKGARQFNG